MHHDKRGNESAQKPRSHEPQKEPETDTAVKGPTSFCSVMDTRDGCDHSMIVPVWVRHKDNPGYETLEYAILDDQSNVGFVSKKLCDKLDLQGTQTQLHLTTMHESNAVVESRRIQGLEVLDYERKNRISLSTLFERDVIPAKRSQIPRIEVAKQWKHLKPLANKLMPYDDDIEVSLLIGSDCPSAVRPREVIAGGENDPYAQKSLLGWGIIGNVCKTKNSVVCNKAVTTEHMHFAIPSKAKELLTPERVLNVFESDFTDLNARNEPYSVHDDRFMNILESGVTKREDGHYEMPLPLKSDYVCLPYNYPLAMKRLQQLTGRFRKNLKFYEDYKVFMKDMIENSAEKVPRDELEVKDGKVNYIPHTGVYHPKKKDQIRVVFDCSAQYGGVCLNDYLLQGPLMMNNLLGVLCRFRMHEVAVMTDIKGMFLQFFVNTEYRNLLRFLWYEDGDTTKDIIHYRMKVHLFGAASSPGCANFGLKKAASDGRQEFGERATAFIQRDFYVDDGLTSVKTAQEAISLLKSSQALCDKAGLKLHKFMSNSKEVLEAFDLDDRAKSAQRLNLTEEPLPIEQALGVVWCAEEDCFQFRIDFQERPHTRRGVLSTISTIYDPNGFVCPVILKGKQILQTMCRDKLEWDSPIPKTLQPQWNDWKVDVLQLQQLKIPRCYKPEGFGTVKRVELHYFSDASEDGYGQCTYIRLLNASNQAHCSLIMAKSRVTPVKHVTVARLELAAAVLSAKTSAFLKREIDCDREYFWTDSTIVLSYIQNEARRFHTYVANRVQMIRNHTDPNSWFHVGTDINPADLASRGMSASSLINQPQWLHGPAFLWIGKPMQAVPMGIPMLDDSDNEVKAVVFTTVSDNKPDYGTMTDRFKRFSSWTKLKKAVAVCLRFKSRLVKRAIKKTTGKPRSKGKICLTVAELKEAEKEVIRHVQREQFGDILKAIDSLDVKGEIVDRDTIRTRNQAVKRCNASTLYKLDPYVDQDKILRVGGRVKRGDLPIQLMHPIIMPKKNFLTTLLIQHCHLTVNHMGRGMTHNAVRQNGYWLINGTSEVSGYIASCVTCKKMRGALMKQRMSDLPIDRIAATPPFSYCAVDYFGPFEIKERRSTLLRYGVLFTCMSSRAIHLEAASTLDTSSFINALRRFISRRGPVRQLRSDQGTNFVGAKNDFHNALAEMNQDEVAGFLLQQNCDWVPFKMNVPHSSHMGGSWERQIGTVRSALQAVMVNSAGQLNDEAFRTLLTEVECIVNSRPLSTININDSEVPEPLTPNHLLTMKMKVVLPPPGVFQREDLYCRKWWRRIQYLANEFWVRWRKDFLQTLQVRQKWTKTVNNLEVGDIVICKESDNLKRNQWPLAKVVDTYPSEDGLVRKVKLLMASNRLDSHGKRLSVPTYYDRPIHKVVLLVPANQTSSDS